MKHISLTLHAPTLMAGSFASYTVGGEISNEGVLGHGYVSNPQAGKVVTCAANPDLGVNAHMFSEKFDGYLFGEKKEMTWKKPKPGCIGGIVYYCDKCDKMVCEFCYTHAQSMIEKKRKEAKRCSR